MWHDILWPNGKSSKSSSKTVYIYNIEFIVFAHMSENLFKDPHMFTEQGLIEL